MCNAPKFGEIEERTGYGGGYNDRGVVEYKERRDDDDEYDEFGRRKKKRKIESRSDDDSKDSKYSSPSRSKSRDKDERNEANEDEQAEENVISYHSLRQTVYDQLIKAMLDTDSFVDFFYSNYMNQITSAII